MKRILILTFFVCVICSSLCFGENKARQNINSQSNFAFSKTNNEFPNIFRSIGNLFKRIFEKKVRGIDEVGSPYVTNLILSLTEITAECKVKSCSDIRAIAVFTVIDKGDADTLIYGYDVSAGKIIGQGEKVVWDLSGVRLGTYTITAKIDDGCGYCGPSMTKTVVIKKCPDCKDE